MAINNPALTMWCCRLCDTDNGLIIIPRTGSVYTTSRHLKRKHGIDTQD
jgi:hypothetical protein